jgi:hypothetical protein
MAVADIVMQTISGGAGDDLNNVIDKYSRPGVEVGTRTAASWLA